MKLMGTKFRVWDKENEVMSCIDKIDFNSGVILISTGFQDFKDVELFVSTNLTDKNGLDIFRGDIVKVSYKEHSYLTYITYSFGELTIKEKYIPKDFHYFENPLDVIFEDEYDEHHIEVVGNIYEHSHLLKERK